MSEQTPPGNSGNNSNNAGSNSGEGAAPRRNNRNRNRNRNRPRPEGTQAQDGRPQNQAPRPPREAGSTGQAQQQGQGPQGPRQPNQQQNRRPQNNNNRNRPRPENRPQHGTQQQNNGGGFSFERIYEKYLNLLDQHIIARRKYHDLFYRADPNQKYKLEKNFYNTLNDIRDFESKLAPDVKTMFEKRNNGLQFDRTYTQNHEISIEGDHVPNDLPPAEPHYLQSQKAADYSEDKEESVGCAEDYLKYKNIF